MSYIDFGGGSKQTPVKETNNNSFTCNNCIHRKIINEDLFYCTVYGNIEFCNNKKHHVCLFKDTITKQRKIAIAIYIIKEDGVFAWTGYTSLFCANNEKSDDDVIKMFYEKAVPDIRTKQPKLKDKVIVPIIVAEAIENGFFKPIGNAMPSYIIDDIIKNFNDNIDNLNGLTDK